MNDECVVGVYDSLDRAEQAVRILRRGGLPAHQVSLAATGLHDKPDLVPELTMEDDSLRDAAIGAGLGGAVGIAAGLGALAVSGGIPLAAGLTGATVGAYLGALAGWGVHHHHIQHYEQCVKNGKVLIIVHGSQLELDDAHRILRETDAAEVRLHVRTSAESPEVAGR